MDIFSKLLFFGSTACPPAAVGGGIISSSSLPKTCASNGTLTTIFLIAFSIIGGVAFLFMVIAGSRYVFSKGEPDNIQKAKNEIKYSIIGLMIAAFGAAIVNIVTGRL